MKTCLAIPSGLILILLLLAGVCNAGDGAALTKAFVSISPQKYFVKRIGGELVDVAVLVGPGQSPATYEPTPRQMAELSRAKVFFRIGVPFEKSLIPKIKSTFRGLTVVDTRKGIKQRQMTEDRDDAHEKDHNHNKAEQHVSGRQSEHHHEAGEPDPHIWLDPILVKIQAKTICDALSKVDPQHIAEYRKNLKDFENDLDWINAKIGKVLAPLKGEVVFVFHPAYGYFADRYGLKQVPVEIGGKKPSAKQLSAFIDKAKRSHVKVIFVQPQFDRRNAETVAEAIKGIVVSLDPLAPDYIKNLSDMASRIESALVKKKP